MTRFEHLLQAQRRILICNFDHPETRDLDLATVIGGPLPYGPVIMPADGAQLGLAWAKGGNDHTGMAIREFGRGAAGNGQHGQERGEGDCAAVFTTAVKLPAGPWRSVARHAGAHVYAETSDVFLASNCVVALHSLKSERKRIALPASYRIRDLIDGTEYAESTDAIEFDLCAPETRVFHLEKCLG